MVESPHPPIRLPNVEADGYGSGARHGVPGAMSPLPPLNGQDSAALWERFRQLLWHDTDLALWLDVSRMALEEQDLVVVVETEQLTEEFHGPVVNHVVLGGSV